MYSPSTWLTSRPSQQMPSRTSHTYRGNPPSHGAPTFPRATPSRSHPVAKPPGERFRRREGRRARRRVRTRARATGEGRVRLVLGAAAVDDAGSQRTQVRALRHGPQTPHGTAAAGSPHPSSVSRSASRTASSTSVGPHDLLGRPQDAELVALGVGQDHPAGARPVAAAVVGDVASSYRITVAQYPTSIHRPSLRPTSGKCATLRIPALSCRATLASFGSAIPAATVWTPAARIRWNSSP